MRILIQKFGGTSVATKENRLHVIKKIKSAINNGYTPVIVVSAMGRKGLPYATDTLLSLVTDDFKQHNPLGTDLLLSCGEIISSVIMCNDMQQEGLHGVPMTGGQAGIITDTNHSDASTIDTNMDNIYTMLQAGLIPVVTGFQGMTKEGFFTTLGRGGSDTSASILGAALNAEAIEIYTDVDGIMTADPRVVDEAQIIHSIDYQEIVQFAKEGAKVIHPKAVEVAMKANIPLIIKNTFSDFEGTIIKNNNFLTKSSNMITGITSSDNRIQITTQLSSKKFNSLLNKLHNDKISIDLINIFTNNQAFTIDSCNLKLFDYACSELKISYNHISDCTKVSIIGSAMHNIPGVMASIHTCLNDNNIDILQTSDSNSTIWVLIHSTDKNKCISALHKHLI